MKQRIFKPLGMNYTSYPSTTKLPTPFWNGITDQNVTGNAVRNATHWSPTFEGAAGQMPNQASVAGGREYDFAVGKDHGWLSHSGVVPGYNTQIGYLPKEKATIVVFTNSEIPGDDGSSPAPSIFSDLAMIVSPSNIPTGSH